MKGRRGPLHVISLQNQKTFSDFALILIPDRNLGSSNEQKSCQTRRRTKAGCRPSRPTTKFGAIYATGNPRFLLGISIKLSTLCRLLESGLSRKGRPVFRFNPKRGPAKRSRFVEDVSPGSCRYGRLRTYLPSRRIRPKVLRFSYSLCIIRIKEKLTGGRYGRKKTDGENLRYPGFFRA